MESYQAENDGPVRSQYRAILGKNTTWKPDAFIGYINENIRLSWVHFTINNGKLLLHTVFPTVHSRYMSTQEEDFNIS